jgi:hypothetical protein
MEVWNRDELYAAVWEEPLIKVAPKYGVSAVMIGKVCRKLKVPLPGRGYWARMQFGHPPKREPLPVAKDLPVIQRFKTTTGQPENPSPTGPEPSDAEYLRIIEFEARQIPVVPATKHKLIDKAERAFKNARADDRGILQHRYDRPCLDIRVTKTALERALAIVNNIPGP